MCLTQAPQRSDAGEALTRGPSVSSQVQQATYNNYRWTSLGSQIGLGILCKSAVDIHENCRLL